MRVTKLLRRHLSCDRGGIGIVFAFMIVPIVAAAGIAIDFARASHARMTLQSATDAAALSAANTGVMHASKSAIAGSVFSANVGSGGLTTGAIPSIALASDQVTVSSTFAVPATFTKILGYNSISVRATSSAALGQSFGGASSACVLALSKTAEGAFYVNGTTNFEAINCSVFSNSSHAQSIRAVGSPTVSATSFCTVGHYDITSNFVPIPTTGCSELRDPFAALAAPSMSACTAGANKTSLKKGLHTLTPGTYCGGLELMAQSEVTFDPGVYVIRNGDLTFRSGSISVGDGVVFYLTGTDASLDVNGGSDVDIKAPSTGPLAGMVVVQDKTANPGATSYVQGGGTVRLTGGLYFPTQILQIGGNGDLGQSVQSWAIVADQVHLKGNGTVRIEADFAATALPDIAALPTNTAPRILN